MTESKMSFSDTTCVLTADEQGVAQMIGDAWNAYLLLPVEHPCDKEEFCRAIHACQNIILSRPAVRALSTKGQGYK